MTLIQTKQLAIDRQALALFRILMDETPDVQRLALLDQGLDHDVRARVQIMLQQHTRAQAASLSLLSRRGW